MSIAILNDKGRMAEHVTPADQPPVGIVRPQHTIRGIVVRLERGHYEWAKVCYDYFVAMPRYITGGIRRGGAVGGKPDDSNETDGQPDGSLSTAPAAPQLRMSCCRR